MKRRITALLLVVLMVLQMLPIDVLAEGWSTAVSNEARGAEYVNVKFQYPVYTEDENGNEIIEHYTTIVEQLVKKGETAVVPNIPDVAGREFTGWVDAEDNTPLDVSTPLNEDTVFTANYQKLGIRTVTINYVFDSDGSMAQEPYVAEFKTGSEVKLAVKTPELNGFEVAGEDEIIEVDIPSIEKDVEYEVRYKGKQTSYTVKYHFQNATDNNYTEGYFYRDAIHGHQVGGTAGKIVVGPYTIKEYPEGTSQAGKPVIAGGMTEVRNFKIEGFVQQKITQRRVMPEGKTVVDVYYDREVNMYTIDNDGGTAVDSRALRYGAPLGLPDASKMERPGYEFVGFFSQDYVEQGDGTWVPNPNGGEQKHDSTCKMPPYDFTIEVRWKPKDTADYKVVYWVESVKDAHDTRDEDKVYDFLTSETFSNAASGSTPTIRQLRPQDHGLNKTFYALNPQRSEIGTVQGWGSTSHATAKKEIASDGSTVINVYFDRQTVTFEFGHYEGRWNPTWVVDETRIGLYGQSWREAGYGTKGWPGGRWNDESGHGNGNWTYLDGFNHEDLTACSVRFEKNNSSGSKDIYQYIEALDSTPENRKWIEADHYEYGSNNFNLSSKFLPGFTLYGYTKGDSLSNIIQGESDTSVSYSSRLNVFSTRNSFTLEYANCAEGSMDNARVSYKYEEKLEEPTIVPERPDNVEADHEFAGWYLDEGFQVPMDWGTYTMPAANLVVYAKWAPPTYTVTYHDIRTNRVNQEVTHTKTPFEVEKFGTLIGREDIKDFYQDYVTHTTTYKDPTDKLTYTFMGWYLDQSYTVEWDYGIAITGDRDVYAKWEPSGKVYYRYVFQGMNPNGTSTELGKWPKEAFDETVWPNLPYGTFAEASTDFPKFGLTDFPEYEGWRPISTLSTTREQLTKQYQEIPVYYVPATTWPLTIHYVDEKGAEIAEPEKHDLTEAIKVYEYKHIPGYKLTSDPQLAASKDMKKGEDGRIHITFTYKKIQPLSYKVEYYLETLAGEYELKEKETVIYSGEESKLLLGETATLKPKDYKTFTGYEQNANHAGTVEKVILQSKEERNVLRLYYDLQEYTVTYRYVNAKPEGALDVYPPETHKFGETVTVKDLPTASGYTFRGWYNLSGGAVSGNFTMPAADVILQGNWAAKDDTEYQVHFYRMQEDGTYPTDPYKVTRAGMTDTMASVTDEDKADKTIDGLRYTLDTEQDNVFEGTIAGDRSLVLKLYFKQVKANYTVHHYLKDTQIKVAEDQVLEAQVGSSVTASSAKDRLDGFANAKVVSAIPQNATITVKEDEAQNVITLYYNMPLTLRANSAAKTYDGTPLTERGFTVVNPKDLVEGITAEDITLSMTKSSTVTNPGSVANTIDRSSIRFKGEAVPSYYTLTLEEGRLEVLSRLSVTKTVMVPGTVLEGENGSALEVPAFRFTLTKDGQPVAGAEYSINGQSGTTDTDGSFSLSDKETAVFNGLEAGVYTVEEMYSGDWIPDGSYEQTAAIANSGVGDVKVEFTNRRSVFADITLQKQWVDGEGTAAERPETLAMTLTGTADGKVVYTAPVTLKAEENWTKTVTGLPKMAGGKVITYNLTEKSVPEGYHVSYSTDGRTVTNTVNQRSLTIQGTKTWVDGGYSHNNTKDITLTLQRRVNGGAWSNFNPGADHFKWDGNKYTFDNLPAYNTRGYAYEYRISEKINGLNVSYTTAYTDADGKENGGVAVFEGDTATVNITNTIVDPNNRIIYGFKKWVDGGKVHNNAEELTITLERKSNKEGSPWEPVPEGYKFGWNPNNLNQYGFVDLERYDDEGYRYIYRVTETINDPKAAALYETTYSPANGETVLGGVWQVDITNTLKDSANVTVSGTKTWVDGGKAHDNATEITLTLSRISAKPESKAEQVDAEAVWNGNTYTFSGLDRYDAEGYAYTYTVEEASIEGYKTVQDGNNFTNTIEQEMLTIQGTKSWSDGNEKHTSDQVALTLQRQANGGEWETVTAVPQWFNWTYTYENLLKYDDEGNTYTYKVAETKKPDGYAASYDPADGVAPFGNGNTAQVDITNTVQTQEVTVTKNWIDTFEGEEDYWNLRPENVTVTLTGMVNGQLVEDSFYNVVVGKDSWSAAQNVRTHDAKGDPITYTVSEGPVARYDFIAEQSTTEITPANGETDVQVTNSLRLLGGNGELTVTKIWDDKDGSPSDRPKVSFKLLHADETPVTANGQELTVEPGENNIAVFTNVPANTEGYIVEEIVDSETNKGKYVCKQPDNRVQVAAGKTTAEFTNTRTMALVTVTKKIVDETIDSAAGLSQKFTFSVDGGAAKSKAVGNGESVTFQVEIGKEYSLSEYAQDGSKLPEKVWSTEGLGSFTATEAAHTIEVTNARVMKNGNGDIVVNKIWHNGDAEALTEELTPASIDVQLYEGENADTAIGEARTLNTENSWTTTYSKLPTAAVDGTEKIYSVKELVDGKVYGTGEELMIGELKFIAEITETGNGFEIINTLQDNQPEKPEKEADKESQEDVQVGDLVTYTIRRTSHLSTVADAIVTDTMPDELAYVRTDSVKVNGKEVSYQIKPEANKITWYVENVPPMGEVECVLTAQVTKKAMGTIQNEATVGLGHDGDMDFENDESTIKVARFSLTKEAQLPGGKSVAAVGDTIHYKITVSGLGAAILTDLTVKDEMFARAVEGSILRNGKNVPVDQVVDNEVTLDIPLREGTGQTVEYDVIVTDEDILRGTIDNLVTGRAKDPAGEDEPDLVATAETHTPTEKENGHLMVIKTTDSQPANGTGYALGETISYKITVTNDGNLTITDIEVIDSLSDAEGKVIGRIESLKPGESRDFDFHYVVTETDILNGSVKNVATVTGKSPDPDKPEVPVTPGEAEDDTEEKKGHLTTTKTTTSQPENGTAYKPGEKIVYSITVINDGNLTLTDVVITDELTEDIWKIASIAPGEKKVFETKYVVTDEDLIKGCVINEVTISGIDPEGGKVDGGDVVEVPVIEDEPKETESETETEEQKTEQSEETPDTGDTTNWFSWLLVLAVSGGILTGGILRKCRRSKMK